MNKYPIGDVRRRRLAMPPKPAPARIAVRESRVHSVAAEPAVGDILTADALDDRIAIVGTAGSGKTYAAKGFVERLLDIGARIRSGCGGDCARAPTAALAAIRSWCSAGVMATCRSTPRWALRSAA